MSSASSAYNTQTPPPQIPIDNDDWENVTERLLGRIKDIARRAERLWGDGNITDNLDARRFAVETSEQFKNALEELERYRESWKDAVTTKKGELSTLEPRLTKVKANVQEKERELENLRVAIRTEQGELQGKVASNRLIDRQVDELTGELETLRKEKSEAIVPINKTKAQSEKLAKEERRLQAKEQDLDIRGRTLDDKENALVTTSLEQERHRYNMDLEREDLTASRFILRTLLGKTGTVVSVDTQLGASLSDLKFMSTAINDRYKLLETEKANTLKRLSNDRLEHDLDKRQIIQLADELGESRVKCGENANVIETLRIEVQSLRKKHAELTSWCSTIQEKNIKALQINQILRQRRSDAEIKASLFRKWLNRSIDQRLTKLRIADAKESFDNIMDNEFDSAFKLRRERQLLREIYNERLFLIY